MASRRRVTRRAGLRPANCSKRPVQPGRVPSRISPRFAGVLSTNCPPADMRRASPSISHSAVSRAPARRGAGSCSPARLHQPSRALADSPPRGRALRVGSLGAPSEGAESGVTSLSPRHPGSGARPPRSGPLPSGAPRTSTAVGSSSSTRSSRPAGVASAFVGDQAPPSTYSRSPMRTGAKTAGIAQGAASRCRTEAGGADRLPNTTRRSLPASTVHTRRRPSNVARRGRRRPRSRPSTAALPGGPAAMHESVAGACGLPGFAQAVAESSPQQ